MSELKVEDKVGESEVACYRALISSFFTKVRINRMNQISYHDPATERTEIFFESTGQEIPDL